jgi:ATP-dependent exoDNAse (exonuclease V) alpha subunit
MLNLTPDQEKAVNLMQSFIQSKDIVFTLSGVGGAGKTTILKRVIENYSNNICAAAVSHSAKEVLSNNLPENVDCFTIAQLLKYKQYIDNKGNKVFKADEGRHRPISVYSLIIIDECSMIDELQMKDLLKCKKEDAKIIFLGKRLPRLNSFNCWNTLKLYKLQRSPKEQA